MPTTAAIFYGDVTNNDFTDPASGDFRRWDEQVPVINDNTTVASFGASGGTKSIIFDPQTTNVTNSIATLSSFGWVVDLDGTEGMGAVTNVSHRVIKASSWAIQGFVTAAPVAALAAVTIVATIFKRNSDGTRTSVGTGSQSLGLLATTGTAFNIAVNPGELEFQDDETFLVSLYATGSSQLGGLDVRLRIGTTGGSQQLQITHLGVDYKYFISGSNTAVMQPAKAASVVGKTANDTAVMQPAATRSVRNTRTAAPISVLVSASNKQLTLAPDVATLKTDFSNNNQTLIQIPTNRIPSGAGGSTTVLISTIFD